MLECEYIGNRESPGPGDYTELFRDLFEASAPDGAPELVSLDVRGGELPARPQRYDGYLITGSYAGVYEEESWIDELLDFIRRAHRRPVPLVGICFGHQALAHALGGRAAKAESGWELGIIETEVDAAAVGSPVWMGEAPERLKLVYMHQDQVIEPPPDAVTFARTADCPYAGFTIGATALGLQGHPEFTERLTARMIQKDPARFGPGKAEAALQTLRGEADSAVAGRWIIAFLQRFTS
ncbi:MAG: type 1 glutamine amidotransferase [Spirochaetaceae bacterium]